MDYYGALEAGGTKFVCSIASDPDHYFEEVRFPTTTPEETIGRAVEFFREMSGKYPLKAIGAASFGPIDPDPASPTYGFITTTPKPGWQNTDLIGPLRRELGLPCAFDTDVNGAALAEYIWGNPEHADPLVYYTIGTGVGAGIIINGQPVHGMLHPEAGHVLIRHVTAVDPYAGHCPFHGDCLEGLCSGPAIQERFGKPASELGTDHPFWKVLAGYIAQACAMQVLLLSPKKIVLGGGVMHQTQLFPLIREETANILNGYIKTDAILHRMDTFITPPVLGDRAGACGAVALARAAVGEGA